MLGRRALLAGGLLSAGIALLHVVIIFVGAPAYRYFGAGEQMAQQAEAGSHLPALVTAAVTLFFALFAYEFGHALGFAHEQNRRDAPSECQKERQGTDGNWDVTKYDPSSVMNYCNPG